MLRTGCQAFVPSRAMRQHDFSHFERSARPLATTAVQRSLSTLADATSGSGSSWITTTGGSIAAG